MIFYILAMIISLGIIFIAQIHGYIGAVVLGANAVGFDFVWQWVRAKLVAKNTSGSLILGILGGLIARIGSIVLFLFVSRWWLSEPKVSTYFYTFAAILLAIPLWNLVASYKLQMERNSTK
jgi:hypothetical protein